MTTYRSIAATETDPYAPIVAQLMKALALNPIALAEGAPGAPRIFHAAFGAHTAGNVVIEQISPWWATIALASSSGGSGAALGAFGNFVADLGVHQVLTAGTIRIKGSVTSSVSGTASVTSANIRIIKNNTLVAMVGGNFSVDVTVAQDDVIAFGGEVSGTAGVSGGGITSLIANLQICASERRFWRA